MPTSTRPDPVKASGSWVWGGAIGLALGGIYTASPLTVWFLVAMTALFMWAGRGLSERERRYVWGILAVAVAVRVFAVAVLFVTSEPNVMTSFFWDGDGVYLKSRAVSIRAYWLGMPVSSVMLSRAFDHGYGWSSYLYFLAFLQYLTGPAPYAVHLVNSAIFIAAAIALYRLVRSSYGRAPALLGLMLMLFFPTLIAWSVSALKESLYLSLNVLGLTAAVKTVRAARRSQRAVGAVVLMLAIVVNGSVRTGAGVIMLAGLSAGLVGSIVARWVLTLVLVIACLPFAASAAWNNPAVQTRIMSQINAAAEQHRGAVNTDGNSYRLLDSWRYNSHKSLELTPEEGQRFVVRALISFVAVPLPWQIGSRSEVVFLAQQMIWYLFVIFALVGFVAGFRRDAMLTWMFLGLSAFGGAAIALNSGNVGSLVRFRDTIVPFVVWLSALGAVSTLSELVSRRQASAACAEGAPWTSTTVDGKS